MGFTNTVYSEEADMTFILKEDESSVEVVGFYYGEPDSKATEEFIGKLKATF